MRVINTNLTFEEWFISICAFNEIKLNEPLVEEEINGRYCRVTAKQLLNFFLDAEDSQSMFAKLSMVSEDKEKLLSIWRDFIITAFKYGETFQDYLE